MSEPDEWVTIAEGARRLGIDQKQVRRYAARLADTDRTPADVSPVSVRLSAIVSAREAGKRADRRRSPPDQSADTDRTAPGQSADSQQDMSAAALIEVLKQQLAEKDAQIRALIRVVDEDRNDIRQLRAQLAIAPVVEHSSEPAETGPQSSQEPRLAVPDDAGDTLPSVRPWWQFWKRG